MPALLLLLGLLFAALTAISLWPPRRPGSVAFAAWFVCWVHSELPIHLALLEIGVATGAVVGGALTAWPGWVGLALTAASVIGLARHVRYANATTETVERGLAETLGGNYHDRIDPDLRRRYDPSTRLLSLATVFPFRPAAVERMRDLPYAKHGRRTLCLDVYRAVNPALRIGGPGGAPVFLYVHGGAWVIGHKGQQGRILAHELAAAGWVVVSINYRLSPGATWPDHIVDVKRAIRWVREHIAEHGGDPGFVVIGGGSAGAHLASLAALTPNASEWQRDFPDVDTSVQACVAFYGVYDFLDDARIFRHRAFRRLLLERVVMKRRLDDAREEFQKASPIERIAGAGDMPPFLVIHGDLDCLAPLEGARRFRDALRAAQGQVAYVEVPGANHAFELFPSLRSVPVAHGVHRFCQLVYSNHVAGRPRRDAAG